jgi:hypothetical protein
MLYLRLRADAGRRTIDICAGARGGLDQRADPRNGRLGESQGFSMQHNVVALTDIVCQRGGPTPLVFGRLQSYGIIVIAHSYL